MKPSPVTPGLFMLLVVVCTFVLYSPVRNYDFVDYDDNEYVSENSVVQDGLTIAGVKWAFGMHHSNWHPLTWLSHMLDYELFDLHSGRHHLINLLFHIANTILLFFVFRKMTGLRWQSAWVAAIFALHPVHVESVAWIAERKDVLSTFFFLLTLWAYIRYTQIRAGEKVRKRESGKPPTGPLSHFPTCYFLALLFFALGLMSKPMLVTLPFVLLLLDFWPLKRVTGSLRIAFVEKLPFFILSFASSVLTFLAQKKGGAVMSSDVFPMDERVANALVSYFRYIGKMFFPNNLTVLYPHPGQWPLWAVIAAAVVLITISILVLLQASRRGYLAVGWFWFLGTMIPVIGLIQVGIQSMADRYLYIPSIGLSVMIVWGLSELSARWPSGRKVLIGTAIAALVGCTIATRFQLEFWRNSETLFRRAIAVTKGNYLAWNDLGCFYDRTGLFEKAKECYRQTLEINPGFSDAHNNLGGALAEDGLLEEAKTHFQKAIELQPHDAIAHRNLGTVFSQLRQFNKAIECFQTALKLETDNPEAHYLLGLALLQQNKSAEAAEHFREALRQRSDYSEPQYQLDLLTRK